MSLTPIGAAVGGATVLGAAALGYEANVTASSNSSSKAVPFAAGVGGLALAFAAPAATFNSSKGGVVLLGAVGLGAGLGAAVGTIQGALSTRSTT